MSRTFRKIPAILDTTKVPKDIKERYRHGLEPHSLHGVTQHNGKALEIEVKKEKAKKRVKKLKHKAERRKGKREISALTEDDITLINKIVDGVNFKDFC